MHFLILFFCCIVSLSAQEISDDLSAQEISDDFVSWNPRMPRERENIVPCYVPYSECCIPDCPPPVSHLSIGGSYTYAYIKPTDYHSTAGSLGGAQGLYEYKTYDRFYAGASLSWKQGNTNRSGDRFLVQIDVEERLGYTWGNSCKERMLTLFSGFGFRRNSEKVIRLGNKVRFRYDEFYVPLGFLYRERMNAYAWIGINFHWMPQVFSSVTIHPLKGARWALNNKLGNFRGELPITMRMTENTFIVLEPFFEYWRDGHTSARSQAGTSLHVPGNTYLFAGIELNIGYSF